MKMLSISSRRGILRGGLLMLGISGVAFGLHWNGFTLVEWWRESHSGVVISGAQTSEKRIALTFDDGPDPNYTPRILAILQQYGVKATFFQEGQQVSAYPDIARAVVAQGHVIGNHTFSHPYLNRKSAKEVCQEMADCEHSLETCLHRKSYLFRPPRGQWNPTIYREARRQGDHIILWTLALEHHEVKTPQAMVNRVLRQIRPGGILLMHDGARVSREMTVQALPLLLEGLRKRGYQCVTVPELLHIRGDEVCLAP